MHVPWYYCQAAVFIHKKIKIKKNIVCTDYRNKLEAELRECN